MAEAWMMGAPGGIVQNPDPVPDFVHSRANRMNVRRYGRGVLDGTGVLVGRQFELNALRDALAGLETRSQGFVQIAGEQGIGKTRLLAELCALAERCRYLVFSGRSSEFDQAQPFGVLVDALGDFLSSLDRRELEGLDIELDELAAIFPSLGRLGSDPIVTLPAERHRGFQTVR